MGDVTHLIVLNGEEWKRDPYSSPNDLWVTATIDIQRVANGEIRHLTERLPVDNDAVSDFMWRDGNYSCDCNRRNFFCQDGKEDPPESSCGYEEYVVRIRNPHANSVFYQEDDFKE